MLRLGIDLGGTKTEIIALDGAGHELLRRRVPTPQGDYLGTLDAVTGLVGAIEMELGQRGYIGLGIPGAESADGGLIKNANSTCLIGRPLRRDLQTLLHREIRIDNDANCFALSEAIDGAGQGADVVFGAILGTGVGGGIVVHERVLAGANHIAGEWGHNPLPIPEEETLPPPLCYCGHQGCVETWLSGPGLAADHARHNGQTLTPELIATRASQADTACAATLARYAQRLAKALAQVINILDPQVIVLGGGLSNIDSLYVSVPSLWSQYIFSDQVRTRLCRHQHGDSSGVRGAAWLWNGN
ncbi:ROK family protein [Propionivibrio sp.]|uniref:ROK family protein n=1 Tax=Propionivibrio sp. TaxID=2212460 RepID=UPI00261D2019|nr:ROK family protein [Propionivibrio sp.]